MFEKSQSLTDMGWESGQEISKNLPMFPVSGVLGPEQVLASERQFLQDLATRREKGIRPERLEPSSRQTAAAAALAARQGVWTSSNNTSEL